MPETTSTRCSTGSQEPTRLVVPEYVSSDWERCHAINAAGGIDMLPWQDNIMRGWLGRNVFGRWAAPVCGNDTPRQNGKTLGMVVPRSNYGMLGLGEQVLYTSHLQKTSTETFEVMADFWDSSKMRKYVKAIKTALGREQIVLKDRRAKGGAYVPGGRIKFLARTRNGGRGQHGDLLVFDEALELSGESQASFLPAISASSNPQTIYVSTPPTPESESAVFRRIRDEAISGRSTRTAWSEWSVDEIGDVRDRTRWYSTNPSLGLLISEDTIEGECDQMEPDRFARERLGWFCPVCAKASDPVIDATAWAACATNAPLEPQKAAYGVKFTPDGAEVVLAVAEVAERLTHVEVIERQGMGHGTAWLADWLAERTAKASCVVIDGRAGSQALVERLDGRCPRGFVRVARMQDVTAAAQMTLDAINGQTLTWFAPQQQLDESARGAIRRQIGSGGGWGFGGDDPAPIEACSLALWGVQTSKRDPSRKQRIG